MAVGNWEILKNFECWELEKGLGRTWVENSLIYGIVNS